MSQFLSEYMSDESTSGYQARVYFNRETNTYSVRCLLNGVEVDSRSRTFLTESEAENYAENYSLGVI